MYYILINVVILIFLEPSAHFDTFMNALHPHHFSAPNPFIIIFCINSSVLGFLLLVGADSGTCRRSFFYDAG